MTRFFSGLLLLCFVSAAPAQYCPSCVPAQPSRPVVQVPVDSLDGGKWRDKQLRPGDVWIPPQWRVRNTQGNCVWCAVETVSRQAGLESLYGIKERAVATGWHGAGIGNVEMAFKNAKVPVEITRSRDYSLLQRAVKQGTGAYVEIPGHALVLVGIDAQSVRLIDNNGPPVVTVWPRWRFDQEWYGVACCPRLFPRIHRFRHNNEPIFNPNPPAQPNMPHPPLNPAHPKELPEPESQPTHPPPPKAGPVGPQGPQGPAGPPGKDADNAAVLTALKDIGARLDKQDSRFAALENKVDDLVGQVRTRFVPNGK